VDGEDHEKLKNGGCLPVRDQFRQLPEIEDELLLPFGEPQGISGMIRDEIGPAPLRILIYWIRD
jgi:hypothetical protein